MDPLKNEEVKRAEENKSASKKTYEKPAIIYRAPLEAMASACLGGTYKAACSMQNS